MGGKRPSQGGLRSARSAPHGKEQLFSSGCSNRRVLSPGTDFFLRTLAFTPPARMADGTECRWFCRHSLTANPSALRLGWETAGRAGIQPARPLLTAERVANLLKFQLLLSVPLVQWEGDFAGCSPNVSRRLATFVPIFRR